MNYKDKEAFEKWFKDFYEVDFNAGNARFMGQLISWQAACEYKENEIELIADENTHYFNSLTKCEDKLEKLLAENKKLREALKFTLKAAEQMFRPDKELLQGLCPTLYHTLSYSGDLELIMKTKDARKLLDSIKE